MTMDQLQALERLISHAKKDTGQSGRVANFLLAWWNAEECGGFDLTQLWALDAEIAADLQLVFQLILDEKRYPDALGYAKDFEQIIAQWRPTLVDKSTAHP